MCVYAEWVKLNAEVRLAQSDLAASPETAGKHTQPSLQDL